MTFLLNYKLILKNKVAPSGQEYQLQISHSKMNSSKLIVLESFGNLFPDHIPYYFLELNKKFYTYKISPWERTDNHNETQP